MSDSTLSTALKEAYASAPAGVILHTIELRHPSFSAPIRVVRNYDNLVAGLEAGAPADGGAYVPFVAMAFDFTKPEVSPTGIPQITIEIDNVDRGIVANVEAAMTTAQLVECTYREYLSTDLSTPQNNPPLSMTIMNISADVFKVHATAGFPNLLNKRFPTTEYDPAVFTGLVA